MHSLPAGGTYLPQLDGIRAVAVSLVVILHCIIVPENGVVAWIARNVLSNGWIGVDLFFALSGYLITSILLRTKQHPHYFRNFYARRALRIFPLYYAIVGVMAGIAIWLPFGPLHPAWPYLTYTSNLWLVFARWEWKPLGHTWSVAIEEQFYLFFPLIVYRLNKARLRTLLWIVIAISPFVRVAMNALTFPSAAAFTTFCRLDVLAMGALVAVELDGHAAIGKRAARRIRLAFAMSLTATSFLWVTQHFNASTVFFNAVTLTIIEVTSALFICLSVAAPVAPLDWLLRRRLPVATGRISYGIYLIHYPVVTIVEWQARLRMADTWTRTAVIASVSIGATMILATLSWICFERPILRLKKRFSGGSDKSQPAKLMVELPTVAAADGA